jgi:hypothetical protein
MNRDAVEVSPPGDMAASTSSGAWVRFDRRELSGAFGDIGTDFPLLVGVTAAAGLDPVRAFFCFGLMQIASGLLYGLPIPIQPLKLVAAVVIAQGLSATHLSAAAWSIGAIMLVLVATGSLVKLASWIPTIVVRGIQFGLGVKLGILALTKYAIVDGARSVWVAGGCVVFGIALRHHRRIPASVVILIVGAVLGGVGWISPATRDVLGAGASGSAGTVLPWNIPAEIWLNALLLLALPQLPLSLGNSLLATVQLARDWFPRRPVRLAKLGLSYAIFNLLAGALGAVPACHGSGGLAGHHVFGARTGGSVVIYGGFYTVLAVLCLFGLSGELGRFFPLCVLGVLLLFEAVALIRRVYQASEGRDLWMTAAIGAVAGFAPYGFALALVAGPVLVFVFRRREG